MSQYHAFYTSSVWIKRRKDQLRREPLCAMCLAAGKAIPATVADHVIPHRGDWTAFRSNRLQSLCKQHHDSAKKRDEDKGYSSAIGINGWPIDPGHPVYTGQLQQELEREQLDPRDLIG